MLLRWGTELADKEDVMMYLEGSIMGKPLYERFGFKSVNEIQFDLTKYGGEGVDSNTTMIREAKSALT